VGPPVFEGGLLLLYRDIRRRIFSCQCSKPEPYKLQANEVENGHLYSAYVRKL